MRIVVIGPTYPFRGGIAHYTTLLSRELRKQNAVLFVSYKRQYPEFIFPGKSNYDPSKAPVKDTPVEYLIDPFNPLTWQAAVRRIRSFKADMVIFQWWVVFWAPSCLFLVRKLKKMDDRPEILFVCHNAVQHEPNRLKKKITKYVLAGADRLVTHSRSETEALAGLLGRGGHVITGFHPTYKAFSSKRPSKETAKEKLGLNGDVLLFFGFVRKYKGLDILLAAMPWVLREKKVTLLIVGEFWEKKTIYLKQIARNGLGTAVLIVDAYVPNEDMGTYFAAADLVVQPYLSASGSGICQLAYGFNRPVIATRVGSLAEVIEDWVNGRIVPPNAPRLLATAIVESLEPVILRSLTRNAEKTKEKYAWETLAEMIRLKKQDEMA